MEFLLLIPVDLLLFAGKLVAGLRFLSAVLGTGLFAFSDAGGIQSTANDVVTGTGQILDTAAADQNNAVLLQIMAFARNITGYFHGVGQTNSGDLSERRVRLFRSSGLNGSANASLLRSGLLGRLFGQRVIASLQGRRR